MLRVRSRPDGSWTAYPGEHYEVEGGVTRSYYYLGSQRVAMRVSGDPNPANNGVFYFHTDHLGSTSVLSNESGEQAFPPTRYYPYGEARTGDVTSLPTDHGFTGHKHDGNIRLVDMEARWYAPQVGRFISPDTIVPDPANPQSLNRYAYVLNNPIKYTDPSGHEVVFDAGPSGFIVIPPQPPPPPDEPIRIRLEAAPILGDLGFKGVEIVHLPPGSKPEPLNETWERIFGYSGALVDLLEVWTAAASAAGAMNPLPAGLAFLDIIPAGLASYAAGETGLMRLHPSLPEMIVVGQDVLFTTGEAFGVSGAKAALTVLGVTTFGGPAGSLAGLRVGDVLDVGTSSFSFGYDILRPSRVIPTKVAIAFYFDDTAGTRLPIPGVPWGQPTLVLVFYRD